MIMIRALIAGVLLGVLDFVWIKYVPSPFGGLGNSLATWAVAAFLLAFLSRRRLPAAILGAIVCLVVAVPSYYLAAALIQNDDWANLFNATALLWMGFGVVAGLVFGAGGALAHTPGPLRLPAAALPGAVLFAEALIHFLRIGNPSYETTDLVAYGVLVVALGIAVTAVVVRGWRDRALTLLWAIPVTAAGWVLLSVTGFR